jgi:hypothetical protein
MGSRGAVRGGEAKSEEDSRVRLKAGLGGFVLGGKNGLGPGAVHAGPRLYRETRPGVSQLPIEGVTALVFQVEAMFSINCTGCFSWTSEVLFPRCSKYKKESIVECSQFNPETLLICAKRLIGCNC